MSPSHMTLRALIALCLGTAVVALFASPAAAHIGLNATSTAAGSSSVLTFQFSHGCAGSPTERLAIKLPDTIHQATPTVDASWSIEVVTETLDEPIEGAHGALLTERVDQIVFTAAEPIEDAYRATVELQVQLPELEAGTVLEFPTIQTCTEGEHAWIQSAADGSEANEPAPAITLTAGTGDDDASSAASDNKTTAIAWAGLAAGLGGLVLGGFALVRSRGNNEQ